MIAYLVHRLKFMRGIMSKMLATKSIINACVDILKTHSFKSAYDNTFKLVRCDSKGLMGKAFRLRHQVFCKEYGYECPTAEGSYMEADPHDERAVHFILEHQVSNEVCGTLRLILPDDAKPGESFPIQKHSDHPLLKHDARAMSVAEISRFCMAPRFRQRRGDGKFLSSYHAPDRIKTYNKGKVTFVRRRISYAPAALLRGAFEAAMQARILDCVWMAEPVHLETLRQIGFPYRALGPQVKTHGGLQPIIFNIKHVLDNMRRVAPACWEIISDSGRLHDMADTLHQNDWADNLLDDKCLEQIYQHVIAEEA